MTDRSKKYTTDAIAVRFDPRRCIHAAECVLRLPEVFDPGRRPWIEPERASADAIALVVARCPTGALHFERTDGGLSEAPDTENRVRVTRNGPLHVRGVLEIRAEGGAVIAEDVRVALCRCGASRNKPFCDNSHRAIRFVDVGEVIEGGVKPGEPGESRILRIEVAAGGPYRVRGPVVVESADGRVRVEGGQTSLCRCGASRNKPFCDGSHRSEGIAAD